MSDRAEYMALCRLKDNPDYQVLVAKWLYVFSKIQTGRDNAAAKGQESSWRYFSGREKGAQEIMMALDLAIKDLEEKDKELVDESQYNDLLSEIRGEKKP